MDLRFSAADEAFRQDVHAWLGDRLTGPFAEVRGRGGPGREYEAVEARIAWEQELSAGAKKRKSHSQRERKERDSY